MKLITLIFALVTILTSCNSNKKTNTNDLKIPDKVEIKKERKHEQVLGTKVFIIPPKDYVYLPVLYRFQKNSNAYIQVFEIQEDFTKRKLMLKQAMKKAEKQPYYHKEFTLGEYDAFLLYGTNQDSSSSQLILTFGNQDVTVLAFGNFPKNDEQAKQEILSSLLTLCRDTSATSDYPLSNFTIDVSKSEFKFNSYMLNAHYYTIDGKGNPQFQFQNLMSVKTSPAMKNFEERKIYIQAQLQYNQESGVIVSNLEEKEIEIDNIKAYEITSSGTYKGKSFKNYEVVLGDDKTTLLFWGVAFNRQDELLKQFKEVAQTIRIK